MLLFHMRVASKQTLANLPSKLLPRKLYFWEAIHMWDVGKQCFANLHTD